MAAIKRRRAALTVRQLVEDYLTHQLTRPVTQVSTRHHLNQLLSLYNGWQEYTKLHKETGDNKYAVAGHEEFRHMLLRLSKALEKIDSMAITEAEKAELENFRKAMTT